VVRGGAFNNNQRNVRCAYRNRNNPNNLNNNRGFRVVVAHVFPGDRNCPAATGFRAEDEKRRALSLAASGASAPDRANNNRPLSWAVIVP